MIVVVAVVVVIVVLRSELRLYSLGSAESRLRRCYVGKSIECLCVCVCVCVCWGDDMVGTPALTLLMRLI